MIVKELIKKLKTFDPELKVKVADSDYYNASALSCNPHETRQTAYQPRFLVLSGDDHDN